MDGGMGFMVQGLLDWIGWKLGVGVYVFDIK